MAYGYAASSAQATSQVISQSVTTEARVSTGTAYASPHIDGVESASASFDQVATILVDTAATLHLSGIVEANSFNEAIVRVTNSAGVVVEYASSWLMNPVEFDEFVNLGPGSHQLALSLEGAPTVPDFRSHWGGASLSVSALLLPAVSVDQSSWARIKALHR